MTGATLKQRLRRLEDIEAITTLTARYGRAVDKRQGHGIDLAAIPQIFTAEARWTSDGSGTTVGASAIAAELPSATATVEFSMHAFHNPVITVETMPQPDRGCCGSPRSTTTGRERSISAPI